jgi:hypothetical protein
MANTSAIGPTANQTIAGMTGFVNASRLHRTNTGNDASGYSGGNQGTIWTGCFGSEIPAGATINGFEITSETINSKKGNIGSFGSSGATEEALFSLHLWNGSTLSSAIEMHDLNSTSGVTYSSGNTLVNFVGANKRHPSGAPFGTYGDGSVMAGSPTELGGLSWNVSEQGDFGFGIKVTTIVGTPTYGATLGISLKCYYTPVPVIPPPTYDKSVAMMSVTTGNITISAGNIKIGI